MTEVASQLIEARKHNGDYTRTLASQLGNMLELAESLFGPRDRSYTVLGVEFIDGCPHIRYFGTCRHIIIQLGKPCLSEPARACYQLAHETIHLLSPTTHQNVNVLEEGLAAHFQVWYMNKHYPPPYWPKSEIDWTVLQQPYDKAKILVEHFLKVDPNAIKRLREQQPRLSQVTAAEIEHACSGLDRCDALALTARFNQ